MCLRSPLACAALCDRQAFSDHSPEDNPAPRRTAAFEHYGHFPRRPHSSALLTTVYAPARIQCYSVSVQAVFPPSNVLFPPPSTPPRSRHNGRATSPPSLRDHFRPSTAILIAHPSQSNPGRILKPAPNSPTASPSRSRHAVRLSTLIAVTRATSKEPLPPRNQAGYSSLSPVWGASTADPVMGKLCSCETRIDVGKHRVSHE